MEGQEAGSSSSSQQFAAGTIGGGDEWMRSVERRVRESTTAVRRSGQPCTIYRVPASVRSQAIHSYEPSVVSIGPYHRRTRGLRNTEELKWKSVRYLVNRCRRSPRPEMSVVLDECLLQMKALETRARSCYSEPVEMQSNEFAEMMLLDGCFIIHILLILEEVTATMASHGGLVEEEGGEEEKKSPLFDMSGVWSLVETDLLMLENQIPFFIIQTLFDLLKTPRESHISLINLALKLFSNLHPAERTENLPSLPSNQVHHLLHLFHSSLTPSSPGHEILPTRSRPSRYDQPPPPPPPPEWIPSATELQEVGVKFRAKKHAKGLIDVTFSKGVLEIAPLHIHDCSRFLFRNLIAFELYGCPDSRPHITSYVKFMGSLVRTTKDVRLLHLKGVIVNGLSTDGEVCCFFDHLCNQVPHPIGTNYLQDLLTEVARYHESKWNPWRAGLVRGYFSNNPWVIMSVTAAVVVVVLLLTNAQTFFAAYSYFKPPQ